MKLVRKMVAPTIWIILLSFMFFGIENLVVGLKKESNYAGKVFGKGVSWKEFNDALRSAEFFHQTIEKQKSAEEIEMIAWQNIVLLREADEQKITASDQEVRQEIKKFFGGTEPEPEVYEQWVAQVFREKPRDFEERVRKLVKIQKLTALHAPSQESAEDEKRPTEPTEADKKFMEWWNDLMRRAGVERYSPQ